MKNFIRKINYFFLPKDVQSNLIEKYLILIGFCWITHLFCWLYVGTSFVIGYKQGMILMTISAMIYALNLFLIKRKISYNIAANIYIFNATVVAIFSCSYFAGGLASSVIPWFSMIPVVSLLLLGSSRQTAFWFIVSLSAITFFFIINQFFTPLKLNYDVAHFQHIFTLICYGGLVGIIFVVTNLFHNKKEQAIKLSEEKNVELRNTLDQLHQMQKQLLLNEKMASLGQLMAGIAHEINNPINFVSSNIAPLKRDFADISTLYHRYKTSGIKSADPEIDRIVKDLDIDYTFKEVAELLDGIEVGAKRTAEIVKGLKTFSRLDEVEKVNYDLEEGLEGTLLLLSSKISKKEIEVEKHFGTIPMVKCFSGKINQVFMNIIANGIDALTEKGKLIITTKIENDNAIISIEDNGMGMSEETQAKIFDPFFTTKDVGSGTGLGLSITYGIIESHNGKIEVNSEIGKGTKFTITLPLS